MKKTISILSALYIALSATTLHALNCPTGTKIKLKGEINNNGNVVLANGLGKHTLGVAELTLKDKSGSGKPSIKLNCALLGEPRGISFPPTEESSFDHLITCDGPEVAFKTRFVDVGFAPDFKSIVNGNPVLSGEDFETYCGSNAILAFVERADVNEERDRKGLFDEARGGVNIFGCVNAIGFNDMGEVTESVINMRIAGKLCLLNW